jgi:hypothetical protein
MGTRSNLIKTILDNNTMLHCQEIFNRHTSPIDKKDWRSVKDAQGIHRNSRQHVFAA